MMAEEERTAAERFKRRIEEEEADVPQFNENLYRTVDELELSVRSALSARALR